jgi:hypothetical protein
MDPDADPGDPKTFGSYGSGSATLIQTYRHKNYRLIGCILTVSLRSLPDSLVLLERLRWLDLSNNYLKSLPAGLDLLRQLAKLNLSFNQLTQLPIALGNIHTLKGICYHTVQPRLPFVVVLVPPI